MGITDRFSRWRHTKGYGVHSPLAFCLVQHVVKPSRNTIYYGEEKLDAADLPYKLVRRARILLRLVAELQPSSVWISPGMPELLSEAIRLAGCVIRVYDGELYPDGLSESDTVVLYNYKLKKTELRKIMVAGKSLVAFGIQSKAMSLIAGLLKGGVMLEAIESAIAVNTRDEAAHIYKILRF